MYFCAACNVYVKDASVSEHDQSTAHLLASSQGVSVRKVWLPETNRGYQMLKAMGWEEGGGLGPTGDGKVTPIATTFKTDRAGVGVQATAKTMQERLARKRKLTQQQPNGLSKAQRKQQKQREQTSDRAIATELYSEGLEGYEHFLT